MLRLSLKHAIRLAIRAYNTPERKGARGERHVHNELSSVLDENKYKILSDLILPTASGTTQLDHVVLSRFGIFVIETKNMSGWIFGSANQRRWTQIQKGGKRHSFQNPLRQNYAHLKAVEDTLGVDQKVLRNFVVFTGSAVPKTEMPENVAWGLYALGRLISDEREVVFSESELKALAETLQSRAMENTRVTRQQHVEHLARRPAAPSPPNPVERVNHVAQTLCPTCGGEMVKRINRKSGDEFWGCKTFPKCRGTLNIPQKNP